MEPGAHGDLLMSIPVEFVLFALTLAGISLFHHRTFEIALAGLAAVSLYKIAASPFRTGPGVGGFIGHAAHEWVGVVNLAGLLLGFALLSRHFEESHIPHALPHYLPDDWKGSLALLAIVLVLSSFLDNIAGAMIGGAMAHSLYRRLHIGYLAAITAAANAGGAGSVVGDTTTTMMWIHGVSPATVLPAYVAALSAFIVFGIPASFQQQRFSPIERGHVGPVIIDWTRVGIVAAILIAAVSVNVFVNVRYPDYADRAPFLAGAVWLVLLATTRLRRPDWKALGEAARGTVFLCALVLTASMMPVDQLPTPTWRTTFGLGFLSAVFDNIPLTALALEQRGYDWALLAYAVGFGGSMVWFGSSAGVALSNIYPQARFVGAWLRSGWHVVLAYVVGFFVFLALVGWHPSRTA
jgi:Na+/H+ antiporter NhaD/arsenite permease-like protein